MSSRGSEHRKGQRRGATNVTSVDQRWSRSREVAHGEVGIIQKTSWLMVDNKGVIVVIIDDNKYIYQQEQPWPNDSECLELATISSAS